MGYSSLDGHVRPAWNAGRKVGAKRALQQKEVWVIRFAACNDAFGVSALFDDATLQATIRPPLVRGAGGAGGAVTATRATAQVAAAKPDRPTQRPVFQRPL